MSMTIFPSHGATAGVRTPRTGGLYTSDAIRAVVLGLMTTNCTLVRRLFDHTADRMASRCDRFSWFGLLPVDETGSLGKLPASFETAKLIPALEAVLIESLEPRENRRRGDGLESVEYMQKVDPRIDKKKAKAFIQAAIEKA